MHIPSGRESNQRNEGMVSVVTSFYQRFANHVPFCFCETYSTLSLSYLITLSMVDEYVHFYNYQRINIKNGLTPSKIRSKAA